MGKNRKSKKVGRPNSNPRDSVADYFEFRKDITGQGLEVLLWASLGFESDTIEAILSSAKRDAPAFLKKQGIVDNPTKKNGNAEPDEGFSDIAAKSIEGDLRGALRFRKLLHEGALAGSEPAFAALIILSLLTTIDLYEITKIQSPIAGKWAKRFLVWPWFYSPIRGYQKKLNQKMHKLIGRNSKVSSKFSRDATNALNLESMISMLWIILLSGALDGKRFGKRPYSEIVRHMTSGSDAGVKAMKEVLTCFLENLHAQATIKDSKLNKSAQSERRRVFARVANRASSILLK